MTKEQQEFNEYLVNLLMNKGVWLTEKEQQGLTNALMKLHATNNVPNKTKRPKKSS
jgi:hypothetical protein